MSVSYTNTDEGFMLKVGDLVAVRSLYEKNTWTDVFKIIFTGNGYVKVSHCGSDKGKDMFKKERIKHEHYTFDYFIIISELNTKKKNHLPRWF